MHIGCASKRKPTLQTNTTRRNKRTKKSNNNASRAGRMLMGRATGAVTGRWTRDRHTHNDTLLPAVGRAVGRL